MATMTFQINDASTSSTNPAVWVTITETAEGMLSFEVTQTSGVIGDLRGLFFDLADESILKSLVVTAASTDIRIGDDSIKDLGDGANMNGLTGTDKGYDVGIEIGTAGIGANDIRSYSFTLDSTARDLTLKDVANVDFAARLTSVGVLNGARADSSKLLEITSTAIDLQNVVVTSPEDQIANDALLGQLSLSGSSTITDWAGGIAGSTLTLASEGDDIGTLQLNQNGSFVLDTRAADKLSAGESIVFNLDYSARNQDEATSWSTDSAQLTVVIQGANDAPVAHDDMATEVAEDGSVTGSVLGNDSDIDRLDVIKVSAVNGQALGTGVTLASGAIVTMNADGTYTYDTNGAFDALNDGELATDSFQYTIDDGHGGNATATVSLSIAGRGTPGSDDEGPDVVTDDVFPTMAQNISNVVLYLDDGDATTRILKVKLQPDGLQLQDVDLLNISQFLATHGTVLDGNTELLGISIHAGQEYPNLAGTDMTAQGEGAFYFLLDGETPAVQAIGTRDKTWTFNWTNDDIPLTQAALDAGLSYELLAEQAQIVYTQYNTDTGIWML